MKLLIVGVILQAIITGYPVQPESQSRKVENLRKPSPISLASLNEYLAGKTEKLLSIKNNPIVENAKAELEEQIQYNFLRTLSVILIAGPVRVQESNEELLKLMRVTLNGDLDFKSVVAKIPALLREDESTRFTSVMDTIQEIGTGTSNELQILRQTQSNTTSIAGIQVDQILAAASKINWKEIGNFIKELPEIFEGIQTIVENVQDIL
ncbi:unnamed protein product [Allacma fusca]|uniref:Uncharacterized protein n=1 Tax=Allacma fusca TaxID=39272 RepID=A0A8J2P726_9HEXA|nr:unnamed protein product [Allacma fusca]